MVSVVNGDIPNGEIIKASGKELLGELYEIYYGNRFTILKKSFKIFLKTCQKSNFLKFPKFQRLATAA